MNTPPYKIRVWDKLLGKMVSWDDITSDTTNDAAYWLDNPDRFLVLQYLPFHDKNGVQACEHDILLLNCLGWGETYKTKAVIEYVFPRWYFHMIEKPEGVEWNELHKKWEPESEIIGNRYEDAHLLAELPG